MVILDWQLTLLTVRPDLESPHCSYLCARSLNSAAAFLSQCSIVTLIGPTTQWLIGLLTFHAS